MMERLLLELKWIILNILNNRYNGKKQISQSPRDKISIYALKQLFARGLAFVINLDLFFQVRRDRYVLCYHRILTNELAESEGVHHSLWLTPEGLASQIKWMLNIGEIVDYSRLLDTSIPNDRPLFALTFDDGWKDNFEYALPILKYYQVPALIFLATGAVDSGELFWPQDIATKTKRLLANGLVEQGRLTSTLII
jgi:hypothetical protein